LTWRRKNERIHYMRVFCLIFYVILLVAPAMAFDTYLAVDNPDALLEGIARAENATFDRNKIGDRELTYKAYGVFQIRQPYLDDVNRIVGPDEMKRIWGKTVLSIEDIKEPVIAEWCVRVYLSHYGKHYEKVTGSRPTEQIYARIHNGGPDGWKKYSTKGYWARVSKRINEFYASIGAPVAGRV
jgi:hypothetical protein